MLTAAHCSKASPIDTNIVSVDPEIVRLGDKNIIDTVIINIFENLIIPGNYKNLLCKITMAPIEHAFYYVSYRDQ